VEQMAQQARAQLALIDAAAAAENNMEALFVSQRDFPEVFQRHAELAAAQAALDGLLPGLAKRIGVAKLSYLTVHNQVRTSCFPGSSSCATSVPGMLQHSILCLQFIA
jgi:hypothetical protein